MVWTKKYIPLWLFVIYQSTLITFQAFSQQATTDQGLRPPPLIDKEGRIVIYRGLTVSHYAKKSENFLPWQTESDFAKIKDWGFNLVRYYIFWEALEPSSGIYDESYISATLERLQWLERLGIDVLLCIHQNLYHRKFGGAGFPSWAVPDKNIPYTPVQPLYKNYFSQAVIACFDHFWRSEYLKNNYIEMVNFVLSKVKPLNNIIGLEVFDEPWPYIGAGFEQTILTDFYQKIEEMKIKNGFDTPIYFQPMLLTSVMIPTGLRFQPKTKAVYAVRYFDPFYEGAEDVYGRKSQWLLTYTINQRVKEACKWGVPMLVTDFGINFSSKDSLKYLEDWFKLMDKYQLGWVYNSYDRETDNPLGIIGNDGSAKPIIDKLIQPYPQRIAGRNPRWALRDNMFDLQYENPGFNVPTILYIPKSLGVSKILVNGETFNFDSRRQILFEYQAPNDTRNVNIIVRW